MLRAQAIAVLKEIVTNGLIDTAWVSIEKRAPDSFELRIKTDCNRTLIEAFLQKHNLTLEENKQKDWLIIYQTRNHITPWENSENTQKTSVN